MRNEQIQPSTLDGIKRLASQIKKTEGVRHHQALDVAAQAASFENFRHARNTLSSARHHDYRKLNRELFLTIYWYDQDSSSIGRETLRIEFAKSLSELCTKSDRKFSRDLSRFRLVADDHLVSDDLSQSQDFARRKICSTVRELRFMEATGLKPSRGSYTRGANDDPADRLPRRDHVTLWQDPNSGQSILVDEPYMDAVVDEDRQAWAEYHGWHLRAAEWPGMYFPYHCSMFVATDASTGYDFDGLMRKIDSIPAPVTDEDWPGTSVYDHETFLSPLAITANDKRRAKAKGGIYRFSSKTTVPLDHYSPNNKRKPNAVMPIPSHQKVGRMLKAILHSPNVRWSVRSRMNNLRSELEDWLNLECGKKHLQDHEFFDVYYRDIKDDDIYVLKASTLQGNIEILSAVKNELKKYYPDCAPLRRLTRKIDTSVNMIQKLEKRGK